MIYFVNILRNCYGCTGDLATQLFETLHNELKCPGSAFRKQIKRAFVNVDAKRV